MVEKKVNNIKIRFISELKARNSANFLEFGLNPNFSTKINENINKSVHSFDSLMFNIRYSGKLLKLGKKYDMKSVWNKFWAIFFYNFFFWLYFWQLKRKESFAVWSFKFAYNQFIIFWEYFY